MDMKDIPVRKRNAPTVSEMRALPAYGGN